MAHDQPTYASVPGIRVFGMMCVKPDGSLNSGIQRPLPPKRNQYFQSQLAYYQRFKKHTLSKLAAQQKTNEQQQQQSLNPIPSESSDFTTRGIHIVSSVEPENREDNLNESSEEIPSSTYDSVSSSFGSTTFTPTDTMSTESQTATITTNSISRNKRATDHEIHQPAIQNHFEIDDIEQFESSRRSKENDDWPNIPWNEISQQIRDIQWE